MDQQAVIARMDAILTAVRVRMAIFKYHPSAAYAEILWMTPGEAVEFLALRLLLPSAGEEREAAIQRLTTKRRASLESRLTEA